MAKVFITTDSTADLTKEMYEELGIAGVMPVYVTLGDATLEDGINVFPKDIYEHVIKTKKLPKTAARSDEDFEAFFKNALAKLPAGAEIIHIGISSGFSMCNDNAVKAAADMEKVHVIDGRNLSTGTGLNVVFAARMAKNGASVKEIIDAVNARIPNIRASFVIDTLDYLHKGGRCSGVAKFFASVLKLKPTIVVKDGGMIVGPKYKGRIEKIVLKYVDERLTGADYDPTCVFVTYTEQTDPEMVEAVKAHLAANYKFETIY